MRFLALSVLFFTITFAIHAQSEEVETWPIVERCVSEPTTPPDDWSFEGIIFLHSPRAVHGINANVPTPYIIAYNSIRTFAYNGAISPDGHWFAVPYGMKSRDGLIAWKYDINGIRIISTDGRNQQISVRVDALFLGSNITATSIDTVVWLDNENFAYSNRPWAIYEIINPFTDEKQRSLEEFVGGVSIWMINNIYDQPLQSIIGASIELEPPILPQLSNNTNGTQFAILANKSMYIGDTSTKTITHLCIFANGAAFSPSGDIVISDGEQILLIQGENTYRLAYHDGTVFDWRVPSEN